VAGVGVVGYPKKAIWSFRLRLHSGLRQGEILSAQGAAQIDGHAAAASPLIRRETPSKRKVR
jgi:hypothetical protein